MVKHINKGTRQLKCDATVLKIAMEKGMSENRKHQALPPESITATERNCFYFTDNYRAHLRLAAKINTF